MGKPLFVCVTCAQDFTRGYDATRHNSNHHFKQAKIVGFLEYLTGRTNGTLPPPSQSPPRLAAKNRKKILDFGNNNEQKNAGSKFSPLQDDATAIITSHDPSRTSYKPENSIQNEEKDKAPVTIKGPEYGLEINPSLHNKGTSSCCCEDQIRKANIKLYELEALLVPFYGSHYADELIKSIVRHCNRFGDYGYVEECLENHRENILKRFRHIFRVT
jgi:hypothetical protein